MQRRAPVGYALQPFEERLAELETSGAVDAAHLAFSSRVDGQPTHQFYFDRFWRLAGASAATSDLRAYAETVSDGNRAAAHNYLTHGLHSYKGKFFPQIVRALANYAGLRSGASVVDPFVGSGTTTLEGQLMGHQTHGIDKNPLAALIARTKSNALTVPAAELEGAAEAVLGKLKALRAASVPNQHYVERWFPPETVAVIAKTLAGIAAVDVPEAFKDVARLTLSTNLRAWSLQEPTQLRIFRRKEAPPADALVAKFASDLREAEAEITASARLIEALQITLGHATVVSGDAREKEFWGGREHDALITSPPYATALPYIDTDRLSIYALGLDDVGKRNDLEWAMIGNREINRRRRVALDAALATNSAGLPDSICESILSIQRENVRVGVGFRRENLPALLYKYFSDMHTVLVRASETLRRGALCAIVVGDSYTVAGNDRVRIETGSHLVASAEAIGFRLEERVPMGGQTRYLPHQRNTIPHEEILILRHQE